jgi:hypothetical protein
MKCPGHRTWKRTLHMVLLLLTSGAIVNVAVAWACALLAKPPHEWGPPQGNDFVLPGSHNGLVYTSETPVSVSVLFNRYSDPAQDNPNLPNNQMTIPCWADRALRFPRSNIDRWFVATGWPIATVWREHLIKAFETHAEGSIDVGLSSWNYGGFVLDRSVPIRPIWPGFAINTIFYAAILWLAPGKIRRFIIVRRRIRRHRCPACGYQIAEGVGPMCSECGVALPWQ